MCCYVQSLPAPLISRQAAHNDQAIKYLHLGMFLSLLISTAIRLLFGSASFPSKTTVSVFISTLIPEIFLYRYLVKIGTSRKDPQTGALLSSGEDLNRQGVTEWCFDVIYITCKLLLSLRRVLAFQRTHMSGVCQIGSATFGEWVWWLYLSVGA